MANKYFSFLLGLGSSLSTLLCALPLAFAEPLGVIPDGTTQTSVVGGVNCQADCTITGTSRAGDNLFHSFREFSVPENVTATFVDGGASRIFARVSGAASTINGTLSVVGDGKASFFLLNPQGITFGPQAAFLGLGSFVATTGEAIGFADGEQFSAREQSTPLLTVSVPVGVQFGAQPGPIVNRSRYSPPGMTGAFGNPLGLWVREGGTLALVGGDVLLEGGNLTANGGRIEIGSLSAQGQALFSPNLVFDYEGVEAFGDVRLSQDSVLDVSGSHGEVALRGNNIFVEDSASITNFNFGDGVPGSIRLTAQEEIMSSGFGIFFSALGDQGDGADLGIVAKKLTIADGAFLSGGTFGSGNGGDLNIYATEAVEVRGVGRIAPTLVTTSTQGVGRGGNLTIKTPVLRVIEGAQIQAATYGAGSGGNILVEAPEAVYVVGEGVTDVAKVSSGILASSGVAELPFQPVGQGGSLLISTDFLNVAQGAQVGVNGFGSGDSGDLNVNARRVVLSDGAQLTAASAFGNGGNIQLQELETLLLRRQGTVSTRAGAGNGQGNGGNISIEADFVVAVPWEDSDIVARAIRGRGGNISITTRGLYGIEPRRAVPNNGTNDIDASSDFGVSGTLSVNRLGTDADHGLVTVPRRPLALSSEFGESCMANGNRFVRTGPGGFPSDPSGVISPEVALVDLGEGDDSVTVPVSVGQQVSEFSDKRSFEAGLASLAIPEAQRQPEVTLPGNAGPVEATSWSRNGRQEVVLVAQAQAEKSPLWLPETHCTG